MSRFSERASLRHLGFSLVEVVLVLSILAIVTAIAVPRFGGTRENYRVQLAARQLVADLEYASTLARVTASPVTVKFEKGDKLDESYYWFDGVENPEKAGEDYLVRLRHAPWHVVLSDAPGDLGYEADGMPNHSRTFVLEASSDHVRTVTVDQTTGAITVTHGYPPS